MPPEEMSHQQFIKRARERVQRMDQAAEDLQSAFGLFPETKYEVLSLLAPAGECDETVPLPEDETELAEHVAPLRVIAHEEREKPFVSLQPKHSLRHRVRRLVEVGLAAVLVASLLLGWSAILHTHSTLGTKPTPLFSYTSQLGERIESPTWTPDKRYLTFMACQYTTISCRYLVWNVATGKVEQTLTIGAPIPNPGAYGITTSPDGRYVFMTIYSTANSTGTAELANILTGQVKQIPHVNVRNSSAAFSSDSKFLAFLGDDGYLHIWNIATGQTILSSEPLGVSGEAMLTWSMDNKWVNVAPILDTGAANTPAFNTLQMWNAQTGHRLANIVETPTMSLIGGLGGLSPDEQRILTYNPQAGTFAVRDTSALQVLQTLQIQEHLPAHPSVITTWLAGGTRILLADNQQGSLWNPMTGQRINSFSLTNVQSFGPAIVSISGGKGQYIACFQNGGQQLDIRDALTGMIVNSIRLTRKPWFSNWLSGDRYLTVMGRNPDSGQLYDALTGRLILSYEGVDVGFLLSSDSKYLAVTNNPPLTGKPINTQSTLQVFALH